MERDLDHVRLVLAGEQRLEDLERLADPLASEVAELRDEPRAGRPHGRRVRPAERDRDGQDLVDGHRCDGFGDRRPEHVALACRLGERLGGGAFEQRDEDRVGRDRHPGNLVERVDAALPEPFGSLGARSLAVDACAAPVRPARLGGVCHTLEKP